MIWQENVSSVVMVTTLVEGEKVRMNLRIFDVLNTITVRAFTKIQQYLIKLSSLFYTFFISQFSLCFIIIKNVFFYHIRKTKWIINSQYRFHIFLLRSNAINTGRIRTTLRSTVKFKLPSQKKKNMHVSQLANFQCSTKR